MATWDTKRLLDINPKVNAKIFQIIFFVLIFLVNILTHIKDIMMDEFIAFHDYVELNGLDGAPEFSFSIEMYAVPLSTALRIVGIPLSLFFIFLLLKKGEIKTEVKE